ncbi:Tim44 domain-containing protein [Ottowia sp.]|uniref:Tim44 domain-containing protein n=1 Tax=Ottowia sp. TaxID=1898956 RepID=UPI00396476E5
MKFNRILSRLMTVLLAVFLVGAFSFEAEAKRLGGGGSFGRQSGNVTQRQATPPAAPSQATNAANTAGAAGAATARKPWTGMLGGLAAGLGLAWLAHSLGLGAAFGNILLIGLLVLAALAVVGMLRRGRQGGAAPMAYQGAGAANPVTPPQYNPTKIGNDASARPWESQAAAFDGGAPAGGGSMIGSALKGAQTWGIPSDFDVAGFTEAAKRNFMSLQRAWDSSDIPTLRAMMTDEMLAEIQSQLAERERTAPGQLNVTEVNMLEAQLLGIEEQGDVYMASVEFSGMIREDASAGPNPFREVWNMTKPTSGRGGWLVAGVQALQ